MKHAFAALALLCCVAITSQRLTSNFGNHGGPWNWCTHIKNYGMNFDLGLATFLTYQLQPTSALEFGCGIGLYVDYLSHHANITSDVIGIEPENMSASGVFHNANKQTNPKQIVGNILQNEMASERDNLSPFDLVYSIEVAEHIPYKLHKILVQFLTEKTGKYLVFGAARPGQGGTGHLKKSMRHRHKWITLFKQHGLYFLPNLSRALLRSCDRKNVNHRINTFVMGKYSNLDLAHLSPSVHNTPGATLRDKQNYAKTIFPHVVKATKEMDAYCT